MPAISKRPAAKRPATETSGQTRELEDQLNQMKKELDEHVDKLFVEAETLKTQIETRLSDVGDFASIEAKTCGDFKKMRSNIKQISRLEEESRRAHGAAQAECLETVEGAQRVLKQELKTLCEHLEDDKENYEGVV